MKCLSPHNTFGVSGVNSVAAKSNTIEGTGDPFFRRYKTTEMPPYCSFGVIQMSGSPDIEIQLETASFTLSFKP